VSLFDKYLYFYKYDTMEVTTVTEIEKKRIGFKPAKGTIQWSRVSQGNPKKINDSKDSQSDDTVDTKLDDLPQPYLGFLKVLKEPLSIPDDLDVGTKISLGDRMKSYEQTELVPPYQAFIVRADGNSFSTLTSGFPKPFDTGFNRAMVRTANGVMNHFNAKTVFVCSDEITLIFGPVCGKREYYELTDAKEKNLPTHIYSGRHNKIASLVASKCSVLFNKFMFEEFKNKTDCNNDDAEISDTPTFRKNNTYSVSATTRIEHCDAIFDARIIPIPDGLEIEIVNNIIWRSNYDCYRNTVSSYGRYVLGQKACKNKNCKEMIKMMMDKGVDFNSTVPIWNKFGVLCKKITVEFTNDTGEKYTRSRDYNFCTDLITQDRSKTLELFFDKYFSEKIDSTPYSL
jgi:tRNA(His) 5'-end guanylyltransferase